MPLLHTLFRAMSATRRVSLCLVLLVTAGVVGATPKKAAPKGSDVLATVNGRPITRRELTDLWLQTDPKAVVALGDVLLNHWRADGGKADVYTAPTTEIYVRLYAQQPNQPSGQFPAYAELLSNLISSRVVEQEAHRRGILVTKTEALAQAHRLFDQLRAQGGLKLSDEQMMTTFHLPRDLFLNDMMFRVRTERLIASDIARRNGRPIGTQDWIAVRELFASIASSDQSLSREAQFAAAKSRLESWAQEIQGGKSMADVATEHNENQTRGDAGLLNPALRGTGTPAIEVVLLTLKPGELSAPVRGRDGWYLFRVERKGDQIGAQERRQMWEEIVEARRPQLIADLRKAARITSIVPLPALQSPANSKPTMPTSQMPPAPPTSAPLHL